jgi:hypothetical protein
MKRAYLKLCRLIAASGFREREIVEFAEYVAARRPRELVVDVLELRELMGDVSQDRIFEPPTIGFDIQTNGLDEKIERLLISDAGLPRTIAIEELTKMLNERFPGIRVPPESRKGFRLWIQKLCALVPEKELLHLASSLRNRVLHEAPSDWRLK